MRVGIDRLSDDVGDEGSGRAGALKGCEWTVLREERGGLRSGDGEGRREGTGRGARTRTRNRTRMRAADAEAEVEGEEEEEAVGVHVVIRYEKNTYTAVLLRSPQREREEETKESDAIFTHLPLLLTRMPAPLRSTLTSYLASTFDCQVSALRLSSGFLVGALEGWLEDLSGGVDGGDGSETGRQGLASDMEVKEVVKDVHVTFSFAPPVAPALKSLDVVVAAADIVRFVRAGEKILRHQGRQPESDAQRSRSRKRKRMGADAEGEGGGVMSGSPFMAGLGQHLDAQMAMNFRHSGVQVAKIACGAFVLAGEGRVRIVDQRRGDGGNEDAAQERRARAVRSFVARLVDRAAGQLGGEREES